MLQLQHILYFSSLTGHELLTTAPCFLMCKVFLPSTFWLGGNKVSLPLVTSTCDGLGETEETGNLAARTWKPLIMAHYHPLPWLCLPEKRGRLELGSAICQWPRKSRFIFLMRLFSPVKMGLYSLHLSLRLTFLKVYIVIGWHFCQTLTLIPPFCHPLPCIYFSGFKICPFPCPPKPKLHLALWSSELLTWKHFY